jgi:hypothetical protein
VVLFNSRDAYFLIINNVPIGLKCAQIIAIFQCATTFGQQTSSLPPIIVREPTLPPTSQFTIDDATLVYNLLFYQCISGVLIVMFFLDMCFYAFISVLRMGSHTCLIYIYIYVEIWFFFLLESDYFGEEAKWTQRIGEANNLTK